MNVPILKIVPESELTWTYVIKSVFMGVLLLLFLIILLLAVAHSEWEDRSVDTYKTVYDTIQFVRHNYWLDQADRDSVQVIFEKEHYTTVYGHDFDQSPIFDSVFYDTVRYYKK